jgi:cystine transport system substrate-binding protein
MMKSWKKLSVALVALGMVAGTVVPAATVSAASYKSELKTKGTLTVGLEGTYKPFSYVTKKGKLVGYDVEVATAVAKKMGLKVKFVQTKFDSLVAGLDSNKYDVVYNDISVTPERQKAYTFASSYLYTHGVMIVKKGSDLKSAADLSGKKAAQTTSSNYGQEAQKLGAEIVAAPGFTESLSLVENGKADATLNSADSWGVYKKANPKTDLVAIDASDALPDSGAAPILNKKDKKLAAEITKAQKKLVKDGTLSKLAKKYFGEDLSQKQ